MMSRRPESASRLEEGWILSLVGSGLIAASFVFSWTGVVAIAGWALLFRVAVRLRPRVTVALALVQGLLIYVIPLRFLFSLFGSLALALIFLLALFHTVALAGLAMACRKAHFRWAVPGAILWMVAVEIYRCEYFKIAFPWCTPGFGLGPGWWSPWVGVYGGSVLVFAAGWAWVWAVDSRQGRGAVSRWGMPVLLTVALGPWNQMLPVHKEAVTGAPAVLLVQGEGHDFDSWIRATQEWFDTHPDDTVQAVVWPEGATWMDMRGKPSTWRAFQAVVQRWGVPVTYGTKTHGAGPDGSDWYNTALTVYPDGSTHDYYKQWPVPLLIDGFPGTENRLLSIEGLGRVGTPICFDGDRPVVIRTMREEGAGRFLIPSMDPMPWGAWEQVLHARVFNLRAAEVRAWIAVASSSGVTQLVDPLGRTVVRLPQGPELAALRVPVPEAGPVPFYVGAGGMFEQGILFGGPVALLLVLALGRLD